jgi:hypothetical protein
MESKEKGRLAILLPTSDSGWVNPKSDTPLHVQPESLTPTEQLGLPWP